MSPSTHPVPARRRLARPLAALATLSVLAGCATVPSGPSSMALPGSTRTFAQFQADDAACRGYAFQTIGGRSAERAQQDTVAGGAVAGAAIGALAGAAIGGSQGAGVGAGTGLLFGTAIGSDRSAGTGWVAQRRYDHAYVQCMYAAGHKVPVVEGTFRTERPVPPGVVALPPGVPAPPPGSPPPPPPPGARLASPPAANLPPAPGAVAPAAAPVVPSAGAPGASTPPLPPPGAPPAPPPGSLRPAT